MSDRVYMGPLIGWVEPNLRAVDARCAEIADAIVRAPPSPGLWALARAFRSVPRDGRAPAIIDRDSGDEDDARPEEDIA